MSIVYLKAYAHVQTNTQKKTRRFVRPPRPPHSKKTKMATPNTSLISGIQQMDTFIVDATEILDIQDKTRKDFIAKLEDMEKRIQELKKRLGATTKTRKTRTASNRVACTALTAKGTRCQNYALAGKDCCRKHLTKKRLETAAETLPKTPVPPPVSDAELLSRVADIPKSPLLVASKTDVDGPSVRTSPTSSGGGDVSPDSRQSDNGSGPSDDVLQSRIRDILSGVCDDDCCPGEEDFY